MLQGSWHARTKGVHVHYKKLVMRQSLAVTCPGDEQNTGETIN
jgi:hypothetical protein